MCWIGYLMKKTIKYTDEKQDNSNYILQNYFAFYIDKF